MRISRKLHVFCVLANNLLILNEKKSKNWSEKSKKIWDDPLSTKSAQSPGSYFKSYFLRKNFCRYFANFFLFIWFWYYGSNSLCSNVQWEWTLLADQLENIIWYHFVTIQVLLIWYAMCSYTLLIENRQETSKQALNGASRAMITGILGKKIQIMA